MTRKIGILLGAAVFVGILCPARGADNPVQSVRNLFRPLDHHPGNVFLAGEDVVLRAVPGYYGPWKVRDIDGQVVAEGGESEAGMSPGKLPVGFYTVEIEDKKAASLSVLEPLAAPPPRDGPVCVQTSLAPEFILGRLSSIDDAASLAALAGVSGIRDNAAWPWQVDEQGNPRNDGSREAQSFELLRSAVRRYGLDLLVVIEPGTPDAFALPQDWGVRTRKKFPRDLRDYVRFVRSIVSGGGDEVSAWEAWNEPEGIGGRHLGSEIVPAMKAFALAANSVRPDVRVAMGMGHVPADAMARSGYEDAISSYHYHSHGTPEAAEKKRRALDGFADRRPVWATEASYGAYRAESGRSELEPDEQLRQAREIPKIFARGLHAGIERIYYFLFPHFGETAGQFWGVLSPRRLEPRPAYQALAATGRLMAGAVPAGKVEGLPAGLEGWSFRARPDGKAKGVVVLWAEKGIPIPWRPPEGSEVSDLWGRRVSGEELSVGSDPYFCVFPEEQLPAISRAPVRDRSALGPADLSRLCPVVADFRRPERLKNHAGGYFILPEETPHLDVDVYNFGPEALSGTWRAEAPEDFEALIVEQPANLPADGRGLLRVELRRKGPWNETSGNVTRWLTLRGDYADSGESVLSIPFVHCPPNIPASAEIPILAAAKSWRAAAARGTKMEITDEAGGTSFQFALGPAPNATIGTSWAAPVYPLKKAELPPAGTLAIGLKVRMLEMPESTSLEINLVKRDGAAWSCPLPFSRARLASPEGMSFILPLSWFAHIKHRQPDPTGTLFPSDIDAIEIAVIGAPAATTLIVLSDLRWLTGSAPESSTKGK